MRITVLAGSPGTATLVAQLSSLVPDQADTIDVVSGTGDDITHLGLRLCRTTDALLGSLSLRPDPTSQVQDHLDALGARLSWVRLTDAGLATDLVRSDLLARGTTPTQVTAQLSRAQGIPEGVTIRPVTDVPVETHVVIADDGDSEAAIHVREWQEGLHASPLPRRVVVAGLDRAPAAPGVLDAIRSADLVVVAPADPVLEVGPLLAVQGVRDALRGTSAPVVVVDPFVTHGEGDMAGLTVAGLPSDGPGAARVYRDLADGWVTGGPLEGYPPSLRVASVEDDPVAAVLALWEQLR